MITRYLLFKRIRVSSVFCYLIIPFSKIFTVVITFTLAFEEELGQSFSTSFHPISFRVLLIGCSNKELNGNWRLVDNDNNCLISYQFSEKFEVNPETPKKKNILLIKMYT